MDGQDVTTIVVALIGLVGTLYAARATILGRREAQLQQRAADAASSNRTRLDETQQALDATERRAERAEAGETRLRTQLEQLQDELDEERALRRRLADEQETRCRQAHAQLEEAVQTLRMVVVDEISRAAAGERVAAVRHHPHTVVDLTRPTERTPRP